MSIAPIATVPVPFTELSLPPPQPRAEPPGAVVVHLHGLPDPSTWAAKLARCAVESMAGRRPMAQLTRWLSPEVFDKLARRAGLSARIHGVQSRTARVRSVVTCEINPECVEAAVVVDDGARIRAIALRLCAHRGRWLATELQIG